MGNQWRSYIALERFAPVDREEQNDVLALGECFGEDLLVLGLCRPEVLCHGQRLVMWSNRGYILSVPTGIRAE